MSILNLPVPAGPAVGNGTTVNTSALPPTRTINVAGTFIGAVLIEISDDASTWVQVSAFYRAGTQQLVADSTYMRAVVVAYTSGTITAYVSSSPNEIAFQGINQDSFSQLRTVQKTLRLYESPVYGISALRNTTTIAGSATIDESGGEGLITTTANGTDRAQIFTNNVKYIAGRAAESGVGIRMPTAPTGNQVARWGIFDNNNGFFWGWDSTGPFVATRKAGTDTIVRQDDWNIDVLDGTGQSSENITTLTTQGAIFHIDFTWYGYGVIEFNIIAPDAQGASRRVIIHRVFDFTGTSIVDPQLPIQIEVNNDGTATAFSLYFGGRQISTIGDTNDIDRILAGTRIALGSIGTTILPLVSVRRLSTFRSRPTTVPMTLDSVDVMTNGDAIISVWANPTLTNESFGTPLGMQTAETASEVDIAATAITTTNANKIWEALVSSGQGNQTSIRSSDKLSLPMLSTQIYTLAIRAVSGTLTATGTLRWREEW